jgi:N-acetylneuraminic acid mutarotase
MPKPREALAVGVVNGILFAVGGAYCPYGLSCAYKSGLYAYDPATDTWTQKADMPKGARFNLAAGAVGGRLYAVGGSTGDGSFNVNRVEAYDPATNTWAEKAPMPTPRDALAAGVVNGELYAVGGADIYGVGMHTLQAFNPQ